MGSEPFPEPAMAELSRLMFWRHLRAEPNQYILHYRNGRLVRKGAGQAYWFVPLSASVAQVPVEDCETTFVLNERSSDFQDLMAQCTVRYRFTSPEQAASRINFTIELRTGRWVEEPLERLAQFWSQRAQQPARAYLTSVPVVDAIRSGAARIQHAIEEALRADAEVAAMGLSLVSVQVVRIAPTPEVEKAMQTPTREGIQQKADEAVFARRAQAVEKERAIKENELATQVELSRREEELIKQQGANELRKVQQASQADSAKAEAHARDVRTRAQGEAEARRLLAEAEAAAERARMEIVKGVPSEVLVALALREAGQKIQSINHLNVTPDLIGQGLSQLLKKQAEK
jgi:regulator of protease activity HflC (stomatin/prohibitin superfamily)